MISYAQHCEDVMLERVFRNKNDGFYIDVGAWDPQFISVTHHFYQKGWTGINIEPVPRQIEKFRAVRTRDINLQLAISDQPGTLRLVEPNNGDSSLATFDTKSHVLNMGTNVTMEVKAVTLADVCRTFVYKPIDFLKIDVEGWEGAVIASADWNTFRPTVVLAEATIPCTTVPSWEPWDPTLQKNGYLFVYFDGLNRWYVKQEASYLFPLFAMGPHRGDNYTRA